MSSTPNEQSVAQAAGYSVIVKNAAEWSSMTPNDFKAFSAIVFPDPEGSSVNVLAPSHPVMSTPNGLNNTSLSYWGSSEHEWFTSYPAGWTAVAAETTGGSRTYIIAKP